MATSDLLLPEGSVLLHIGPYKTGSTSIQYALHEQRDVLRRHGVLYPGTMHRQRRPGWAVLGRTPPGRPPAHIAEWTALVEEVRDTPLPRVCVSTEDFARASRATVRRIVDDLGADRLHVVTVARRLDRLLPSQWQERVKTCRETKSYAAWLEVVLDPTSTDPSAKAFRASHDLPAVLDRWLAVLPAQQLTVIATDDSDRGLLPRTFEGMLGLPPNLLDRREVANTSLTEEKVELIRRVNAQFDAEGWDPRTYLRLVQQGASNDVASAPSSSYDVRIPSLPGAVAAEVARRSRERVAAVRSAGVHVVGDLERLLVGAGPEGVPMADPPEAISLDAAALAVHGAVRGALELLAQVEHAHEKERRRTVSAAPSLEDASGRELVAAAVSRARARLARRR